VSSKIEPSLAVDDKGWKNLHWLKMEHHWCKTINWQIMQKIC